MKYSHLLLFFIIYSCLSYSIKDKFCGDDNCYQLLFLKKGAQQSEIRKQFRELSRTFHPDKNDGNQTQYVKIVQAYEVLSNEETKTAYDEYLENPNRSEFYHHYRYYQHVYHPQTNPYIVVSVATLLLSIIQYVARIGMYKNAIGRVMETTHFKKIVNDRQRESNLSKDQVIQETLKEVKITGAWSYPKFEEIWIIAILHFIFSIFFRLYFIIKWKYYYKNGKCDRQISEKDQEYKTQLLLGISKSRWETVDKEQLIGRQLWIPENMKEFNEEQRLRQEEYIQQHSNKYKQYKRFQKKMQ
ncbi:unnamed protein product [Paramecium sonneborni]|uniref:J domain-containing protein n=1 Tax=Paramecium sonneborni TaxID=65129 RepID=A0A8S1PIH7_9CILI|nr:unnamed protein product [Paramecium sonneborni]